MEETFERVAEHLYKRQYQTAKGEWRTMFYAIFTDWKGKRRKFPVGGNLEDARDELSRRKTLNKGQCDFDAEKRGKEAAKVEGMTLSKWAASYFQLEEVKTKRSLDRDRQHVKHLVRLLGSSF